MNVKDKILFLKKRLRRRTLFFLILTLMANTFAWFIYSNKVSNNITTGVKSWKINFKQDGVDIVNNVEFKIDSIYPGMPDYTNSLSITNIGETAANISYEVEEIKILDEFYNSDMYSSTDLINRLKDNKEFYNKIKEDSLKLKEFYSVKNVAKLWDRYYKDIYNKYQNKH